MRCAEQGGRGGRRINRGGGGAAARRRGVFGRARWSLAAEGEDEDTEGKGRWLEWERREGGRAAALWFPWTFLLCLQNGLFGNFLREGLGGFEMDWKLKFCMNNHAVFD
jgi:hypothetical protein